MLLSFGVGPRLLPGSLLKGWRSSYHGGGVSKLCRLTHSRRHPSVAPMKWQEGEKRLISCPVK